MREAAPLTCASRPAHETCALSRRAPSHARAFPLLAHAATLLCLVSPSVSRAKDPLFAAPYLPSGVRKNPICTALGDVNGDGTPNRFDEERAPRPSGAGSVPVRTRSRRGTCRAAVPHRALTPFSRPSLRVSPSRPASAGRHARAAAVARSRDGPKPRKSRGVEVARSRLLR